MRKPWCYGAVSGVRATRATCGYTGGMKCVCPECGAEYSGSQGSGGHCRDGCHLTFANEGSGRAHMVGPYEPRSQRRCLTVEEMLEKDWRLTDRGWTKYPPMTAEQLASRTGGDHR